MTKRRYKPNGIPDIMGSKVVYHGENLFESIFLFDRKGRGLVLKLKGQVDSWEKISDLKNERKYLENQATSSPRELSNKGFRQKIELYQEAISAWDAYQKSKSLREEGDFIAN